MLAKQLAFAVAPLKAILRLAVVLYICGWQIGHYCNLLSVATVKAAATKTCAFNNGEM